jgi:LPXTG-motif cell wall-anchored protein
MTRALAVLIAATAVAALPATAAAKEVGKATVCGADGCQTQNDKKTLITAVENGGPPTSPPPRNVPFYRVSVHIKGDTGHPFQLLVAPAARRVRSDGNSWFGMDRFALAAWRKVTRGVRPFPAAKFPGPEPASKPTGSLPPQTYAPALDHPAQVTGGDGTDWWLIAGLAAGALALFAAAAALLTRRRRGEGPAAAVS